MSAPQNKFAISVDVEDYFQVWAFSHVIERAQWDRFELRVGAATRACLDLFEAFNVRGTFFTLGWVAEREPGLVREIVSRGHELASHGYEHIKVNTQSQRDFYEDALKSKSILEDISGVAVSGYRAAGFSIDKTTPWAHETLATIGYRYSSSLHPINHDHYGDASGVRDAFYPIKGSSFLEAPVATVDLRGKRISCAGGGWFRAMPVSVTKPLLRRAANTLSGPVIFYFHPWEIDEQQPRIDDAPLKSRFRHYLNIPKMREKLRQILGGFAWGRIDEALMQEPRKAVRCP